MIKHPLVSGYAYASSSSARFSGTNRNSVNNAVSAAPDSGSNSQVTAGRDSFFTPGYALPASSPQLPDPEYAPKYPAFPSFDTLGNDFYTSLGQSETPPPASTQYKRYVQVYEYHF
jgi:hypothetical protein